MINHVRVLFFANLKEFVHVNELMLDLPEGFSIGDLRDFIARMFPQVRGDIFNSLVALNKQYIQNDKIISDNAEIAFFPPVSGGCKTSSNPTLCRIQGGELLIDDIMKEIITPSIGAIGLFIGIVRSVTKTGKPSKTTHLLYEAYISMAEEKLHQIASEIREKWPQIEGIAIVQRIGKLVAGTTSVLVACAAPHRDNGVFDAAHYGIDRLKEIVPVWKKESGLDNEIWIQGEYRPKPGE